LKPSLKIDLSSDFLKELRTRNQADRKILGQAINAAHDAWGQPHLHAGTGIRHLFDNFYECRSGLKTRLVFEWKNDGRLLFHLEGNHDDIRRFIKESR
jgi:hypothetical protein